MSHIPEKPTLNLTREIPFGDCRSVKLPYPSNSIVTRKYTANNLLSQTLMHVVLGGGYLWLLAVCAVEAVMEKKGVWEGWADWVVFSLALGVAIAGEVLRERQRIATDRLTNSVPCRIWNGLTFEETPSGEVLCGDLLLVSNGESLAADVVLFTTEHPDGVCYVDSSQTLGSAEMSMKHSVPDVQRFVESSSLDRLSAVLVKIQGMIRTSPPNQDFQSFAGQLRLARSPSAVPLSMNNFILRGSSMFGSAWILCCVVATGMETKVMLNSKSATRAANRLESTLYKYTLFAIGISGVLILGNMTGLLLTNPVDSYTVWSVLESFPVFHRLVPAMLFLLFDFVRLMQTAIINKSHRNKHKLHLSSFSLPSCFGQIDYVIADKNSAFTSDNPKVHTIIYRDKMFGQCSGYIDGSHSCLEVTRRHKNNKVVIADIAALCGEKRPSSDPNEHTFASIKSQSRMLLDDLEESCGFRTLEAQLSAESDGLVHLFECMVLCNTITQLDPLKAKNKFEQALINCGQRFGFKLLETSADHTMLEFSGKRMIYKTLASSEYSKSAKRMRVVVDRSDKPFGTLYVKGAIEILGPLLEVEEELFDHIRSIALEVKKVGLVPIMLACKQIPEDTLEDIKDKIFKAQSSIINVRSKIESIFTDLEHNLQYLGIACVSDTITGETVEGVIKLGNAGVKLWVVSNDSETESLASCMRAGFFDDEGYIVPVKDVTDTRNCVHLLGNLVTEFIHRRPLLTSNDTPSSLNNPKILRHASLERLWGELAGTDATTRKECYKDLLKQPFDPMGVNFMVIIDGASFEVALIEEESQKLLAGLLFAARVVCLFSMLPHQKAKVVRFLKHSFSFTPTVLSFADGLSSIPMLNESDVKVGLCRDSAQQFPYLFDAKVGSMNALADFVVSCGRVCYRRLRNVVVMVLFENVMVVTVAVLYAGFCRFSANSPLDFHNMWLLTCISTKPLYLYIGLLSRDFTSAQLRTHPELYRWQAAPLSVPMLMKSLLIAFIEGALLFAALFLSLNEARTTEGFTENALAVNGCCAIMLFGGIIGHTIATMGERRLLFVLAVALSCATFLASILLPNSFSDSLADYISEAFAFPQLTIKSLMSPLLTSAISFAISCKTQLFGERITTFLHTRSSEATRLSHYSQDLSQVWTPSKVWAPSKSGDIFERRRIFGTYKLSSLEDNYQISIFPELVRHIQTSFLILALIALSCLTESTLENSLMEFNSLQILFCCFCVLLFALSCTKTYKNHYTTINLISLLVLSVALALYEVLSKNSSSEIAIALPILAFLSFYVTISQVAFVTLLNTFAFLLIGVFNILLSASDFTGGLLALVTKFLDVLGIAVMSGLSGYFLDDINREKFQLLTRQENELEKADSVLKYLLPEFVRARVKDGVRFIADIQPCVHILFCEICDFDHIIKDYEPVEVISLLNSIYEKFDEICENCGVTKVETVGKVYMACVGIKESEQDLKAELPKVSEAHRLLYFAFEIISAMDQFRLADGAPVQIKVGMHSGKVIAGVVGYHKPQFSLVGDTVNTASRMCSTVELGNTVQMSETSYALLKDTYGVQFDGRLKQIKGKGMMEVFTVWKDSAPGSHKHDLDISDASPVDLLRTPSQKRSIAFARGMTVFRRDSVFEANAEVVRNFQKKLQNKQKKCWKVCNLQAISDKYYQEILDLKRPVAVKGLSGVLVLNVLDFGLEVAEYALGYGQWGTVLLRGISCLLLSLLAVLSKAMFSVQRFSWFAMGILGLVILAVFLELFLISDDTDFSTNMSMVVTMVLAAVHFTGMRSFQLLPFITLTGILCVGAFIEFSSLFEEELRLACVLGELSVFFVYVLYRDVRLEKYFELKLAVTAEIEKTDNLLENLLPEHILDSLKLERSITDHLENTTLLVADIVGFTAWSNDREPSEVIEMLSNMFTAFDKLCLAHKTYKVYTIGDCYIAMGFSGKHGYRDPRQECLNVVMMAVEMKKVIEKVNDDYFTNLDMRIGVHTGEIIGAVVGTNIVRYDVYGRDVLIAFKMEANSKPGLINLSEASKTVLEEISPSSFTFALNTVVDISAIGAKVPCYFTSLSGT